MTDTDIIKVVMHWKRPADRRIVTELIRELNIGRDAAAGRPILLRNVAAHALYNIGAPIYLADDDSSPEKKATDPKQCQE